MLSAATLVAAVAILAAAYLIRNQRHKRLIRSNGCQAAVSFPHKDPVFGFDAFVETGKMFTENSFFPITLNRFAKLGKTFEMNFLGTRIVHSIEPKNIQYVFSTNADNWGVAGYRLKPMKPYTGEGFLTVDGADWHRSRQAFVRGFAKQNISDHKTYNRYLDLVISKIPRDGSSVDLQELNWALYTDTSTLFLFGESFDSLSKGLTDDAKGFVKSMHKAFEGCGIRQGLGPLMFLYRDPKWPVANKESHEYIQKYADRALEQAQKNEARPIGKRYNYLLEKVAEEVRDPIQLRNEALHAFAAANETTANLISNVMWVLARRPEMWARLREEVLTLGGDDEELTFESVAKVKYLQHVMNETHRLYPVFPFHIRQAAGDCILPTGGGADGKSPIYIRAGDRFEASFLALNRDKDIWGPDSEEFRPERWEKAQPTFWEFVPFGGGPRSCVGKQKAVMESAFYVARMLREFKAIEPRDEREWVGEVKITAKNLHGVHVALTPA